MLRLYVAELDDFGFVNMSTMIELLRNVNVNYDDHINKNDVKLILEIN